MQTAPQLRLLSAAILSSFLLAGCGGGSSSSTVAAGSNTGYFMDSGVEGLTYTTNTGYTGTTGPAGSFNYNVGETVTFKLGSLPLGTSPTLSDADVHVTPIDISSDPTSPLATNTPAINIGRLLQSAADANGIDNGIKLDTTKLNTIASVAQTASLSLTTPLDTQTGVTGALTSSGVTPPTSANALAHMGERLACARSGQYKGTYTGTDTSNNPMTGGVFAIALANNKLRYVITSGSSVILASSERAYTDDTANPKTKITELTTLKGDFYGRGQVSSGPFLNFHGQYDSSQAVSGPWNLKNNGNLMASGTFTATRPADTVANPNWRLVGYVMNNGVPVACYSFGLNRDPSGAFSGSGRLHYLGNAQTVDAASITIDAAHNLSITDTVTSTTYTGAAGTVNLTLGKVNTYDTLGNITGGSLTNGTFDGTLCRLN